MKHQAAQQVQAGHITLEAWPDRRRDRNAGACADSQILTFNGSAATPVGLQGPFNFSGWTYDSQSAIILPLYGQSILNQQSSTQVHPPSHAVCLPTEDMVRLLRSALAMQAAVGSPKTQAGVASMQISA